MDLVEIDHIDRQSAKAELDFGADGTAVQYFFDVAHCVPVQAALGKDVGLGAAPLLQRAGKTSSECPKP